MVWLLDEVHVSGRMRRPQKPQDSADVLIGGELSLRHPQGFHWQQDKAEHERKVWQR